MCTSTPARASTRRCGWAALNGFGVNSVTGDLSRGAVGYWIENGEITYPVQEITFAGSAVKSRVAGKISGGALFVPDQVYLATIAIRDTAHQFKKGRRLGVVIQSQMFPSYARNLNTGEPIKNATRMVEARARLRI